MLPGKGIIFQFSAVMERVNLGIQIGEPDKSIEYPDIQLARKK
jgi:hypothetical protein